MSHLHGTEENLENLENSMISVFPFPSFSSSESPTSRTLTTQILETERPEKLTKERKNFFKTSEKFGSRHSVLSGAKERSAIQNDDL